MTPERLNLQVLSGGQTGFPQRVTGASGPAFNVEPRPETEEEHIMSTVPAMLPLLPAPLKLRHGPLTVTLDKWSSGTYQASLPCAALTGEGDSDTEALDDLATTILDFVIATTRYIAKNGGEVSGPLKSDWDNVLALVDISGLPA